MSTDLTNGSLIKEALFSDGTADYCSPMEPKLGESVKIRFRTAKNNVDRVVAIFNYLQRYELSKVETDIYFDYYEVEITAKKSIVRYYFEITKGEEIRYFSKLGVEHDRVKSEYCFTFYPDFSTPDWAKGAVFYQIMVDRFYNGDPDNDVKDNEYTYLGMNSYTKKNWEEVPSAYANPEFYGGDLAGIMQKMEYLKELGIEAIYMNPIFVSPSNHKYDIQDYDHVDPHLGKIVIDFEHEIPKGERNNAYAGAYITRVTDKRNLEASNQVLIDLIELAHANGIKVILDGVFNHCGSFNKWLDESLIYEHQEGYEKGAFVSKDSPYSDYFKFRDETKWPYNRTYDGWWDYDTLPKLNYESSPALYEEIMRIAAKWVSPPFNADGWRLDVAADLGYSKEMNHKFWKDFRTAVKEANPNAVIIAEHYGNPGEYLGNMEWDTVMNYDAFMEPVSYFLTGMEKHSDEYKPYLLGNTKCFADTMNYNMAAFPQGSLFTAMNELSNHDHSRFLTRTNHFAGRVTELGFDAAQTNINISVFAIAVIIQMTWPGAPTVYYADEVGQVGFTDPDNRRTFPWGREHTELLEFHKKAIELHKNIEALKTGSIKFLVQEYNVIAYARFTRKSQAVVVVNNNDCATDIVLPVWQAGIEDGRILSYALHTDRNSFRCGHHELKVENGAVSIHLEEFSALVLV